ncbi:MAG: hydroxyethylthiazole kinase [Bacteroidales bacterium]|nr:hydroxyethylthiazole kinase [Bacteroidales bacterium]
MNTTISNRVLSDAIAAVRSIGPLVHNITNYVVMNNSANALLAIGASPVMAHWVSEMEEMTSIASSLVINIGTLDDKWIDGMLAAGKAANKRGIPIVLDPVGAGATSQRTDAAMKIIELCRPTIIRGNASEIMALVDASVKSRGVDSSACSDDALDSAKKLASETGAVVVISGETDYITDGKEVHRVEGGDPVMTTVTGMGCTSTAIVGAFAAAVKNPMVAATAAMAVMSLAGERAAANSKGNGSMQLNFLDELYRLNGADFHCRNEKVKNYLKLYLVTDRTLSLGRTLEEVVSEAVEGGVTMVQLREKEASTGEFIELALRVKNILKPYNVPLIINDRIDVALAVDADGVHIGQSDMLYSDARKILGPEKIIGLSVENLDDLVNANGLDVDYVGISPVYGTPTKTDTAEPFGLEGLKEAVRLSLHPTVAIGGMNHNTAADVVATGCDGIAVVSAISSAENIKEASSELKRIVDANFRESWCQQIWRASNKIYQKILGLEFISKLSDGTLDMEIFSRYIAQDEIYLGSYYRNMFALADMMDNKSDKELFLSFAQSGMEGEKAMHELLIQKYGMSLTVKPSVVTAGYNNLIKDAINSGNKYCALAVMLPCMWIYNRVGLHILKMSELENNPYKEWIEEYGNEEFTIGVNRVLDIIDNWASEADSDTIEEMNRLYLMAAVYEYAFWDYAYCGEDKSYEYTKSLEGWI